MLKRNSLCHIIVFSFIFFFISLESAHAIDAESNLRHMPQYTATFKFRATSFSSFGTLVLRFYQAFGDGSRTGWQLPVTPPTVTYQGNALPISTYFSYHSSNYIYGSYGLGYDQFAQYYGTSIGIDASQDSILKITGPFQQVAYLSATIYINGTQVELLDREMSVASNELNPYMVNHPSVFAYSVDTPQLYNAPALENTLDSKINLTTFSHPFVDPKTGRIDVYRIDQQESKQVVADDIAPDGCTRAYLFAQKNCITTNDYITH